MLDIGSTKPTSELDAAYVIPFLFLAGLSVVFLRETRLFISPKTGHPVSFFGYLGLADEP